MVKHKVQLVIDTNEHKINKELNKGFSVTHNNLLLLLQAVSKTDECVLYDTLDVGDFHFIIDDIPTWCVERKTIPDFVSSVKSGHFRKQRAKMIKLREQQPMNMAWLIEGNLDDIKKYETKKLPAQHFIDLLDDLSSTYEMYVFHTDNLPGTVKWLGRHRRLWEEKGTRTDIEKNTQVIDFLPRGRKSVLTPENFFLDTLQRVPRITTLPAKAIADRYSLTELIQLYFEYGTTRKSIDLLCGIEYGEGKKITYSQSKAIFQHLMGVNELPPELSKARKPSAKRPARPKKTAKKAIKNNSS